MIDLSGGSSLCIESREEACFMLIRDYGTIFANWNIGHTYILGVRGSPNFPTWQQDYY